MGCSRRWTCSPGTKLSWSTHHVPTAVVRQTGPSQARSVSVKGSQGSRHRICGLPEPTRLGRRDSTGRLAAERHAPRTGLLTKVDLFSCLSCFPFFLFVPGNFMPLSGGEVVLT
ncbi:hypothetical protein LY76DRAFT_376127 [Colletotrichum caudatum]|nr:hypothetical protein LY76DRAFT_376127 [Colletotrichum caudatum]